MRVKSIIKDSKGNTLGAHITDKGKDYKVKTEELRKYSGIAIENAIIDVNGYVRAKRGSLPIEVVKPKEEVASPKVSVVKPKERVASNLVISPLYHGSESGIKDDVKVNYSKKPCDFGAGFYLGTDRKQAINRVCNYPHSKLYTYKLVIDDDIRVYEFNDDVLWALYIAHNRGKINFSKYPKLIEVFKNISSFDVICGYIADDKIADSFNSFINKETTDKVLSESLKSVNYGKQYVIKSQYVADHMLIKEREQILGGKEKQDSMQWGRSIRRDIDSKVESIKVRYRRVGRFIDEILEDYR